MFFQPYRESERPHDVLTLSGAALGAALAAEEINMKRTILFVGDGSLYVPLLFHCSSRSVNTGPPSGN
jgi:hypothetical protein